MKSPYYKSTPKGYVLTYRTPPKYIDNSKQLPVYRVVNEFMNLPQQEHNQSIPQYKQDHGIYADNTKSQTNQTSTIQNQVKYLTREPSRIIEKDQIKSIYTVQENINDKKCEHERQQSLKEYQSGHIQAKINLNHSQKESQTKTQAITGIQTNNHKVLEFQLQKEKILRKNLQKSYQNLLKDLQEKQYVINFSQSQVKRKDNNKQALYSFTDRLYHGSPRNQNNLQENQRENISSRKRRKSFTHIHNQNDINSQKSISQTRSYCEQLKSYRKEDKLFKMKLREDMTSLQLRIEEMNNQILKKQLSLKNQEENSKLVYLQNEYLKKQLQNQKLKNLSQPKKESKIEQSGLSKKEHMHYIFTIMMMFFCLALVVKRQ